MNQGPFWEFVVFIKQIGDLAYSLGLRGLIGAQGLVALLKP